MTLSCQFQVTGFRSYVDMYVKDKVDELGGPLTVIHDVVNERWEVCLTMSEKGFQQVSFVNSIATTKVVTCFIISQYIGKKKTICMSCSFISKSLTESLSCLVKKKFDF